MMILQNNYNKKDEKKQEGNENWEKEILYYLPEDLESIVKETKAIQRKRKILSAADLIKLFFIYAVSDISLRALALAAKIVCRITISDTALRKHLLNSVPFLNNILQKMLSDININQTKFGERNVYLVDGSILRQQGKQQKQQRVHLCYGLNNNCISQVKVTDNHTSESLSVFELKKDDIILADAGYGISKNYSYAQDNDADVVFRITPNHFSLYNAEGEKYDLYSILKKAKEEKGKIIEIKGFCHYKDKVYFAKVIAQEIPEEKAAKAKKRKKRTAEKGGHQIKEETLFYANYIILVTSLGEEYLAEEIINIYRARWQVELLFKRWKQNLSIKTIRIASEKYAQVMVILWLIIWILAEKQILMMEIYLKDKEDKITITSWNECRCEFLRIKGIIELSWYLFIDLTDNDQRRCLISRNGRRTNQNEMFRYDTLPSFIR